MAVAGTNGGVADRERAVGELGARYWEQLLEMEPLLGTEIGDERFDDRLPDPSEAGLARRETVHRAALEAATAIERDGLGMIARTTLDLLEAIARRDLDHVVYRLDRFHAASHLAGPGSLLADIASLQRADTAERIERYLARLAAFPAYVDEVAGVATEAAAAGQIVPLVVVDRSIAQVQRLVSLHPTSSPALAPLASASQEARDRAVRIVEEEIWPAYGRYLDALRAYRDSASATIGLSALPRGDEMYGALIRAWTTLTLDPRSVHEIGVADLASIQEERRDVARRLGYDDPERAVAEHQASGRNTASSRADMVRRAEEQVRRGWEAAPRFFGRLPSAGCEVRPVEEYREADMPFAFYFAPSDDGSRSGIYYVNTSNLEERPLHHLATTTYHEATPGHHFQLSLEQERRERPPLRRFGGFLASSAFIEGWGLYSERLADEMGLFADEYERLGMLDAQGMRAARLIVDTGIHALGWERDRAIAQLETAGVPNVDAVIETDRYIAMPAQALSYKLGQMEIERWRAAAREREGASFSLQAFHDRLLWLGSLPLAVLDRELARLAEDGGGPTE